MGSSEVDGRVSLLQFPEAWEHAGKDLATVSPICIQREEGEFAPWKEQYSAYFFQEHIETEILSLLYSKCHLVLKIVVCRHGLSLPALLTAVDVQQFVSAALTKTCLRLWADPWRLHFPLVVGADRR